MSNLAPQPNDMPEWTTQRAAAYTEAGNMLRHYSSSRTAVLSIALPVCIAILGWVLSSNQRNALTIYLLFSEALLFAYALLISVFFSVKYEQARRSLVRIEAGGDGLSVYYEIGTRLRDFTQLDGIDRSLLTLGMFMHIVYYIYYFKFL